MVNQNVFRGHLRLMTPIELCSCMESEELIHGVRILEPDEQMRFIHEFDKELIKIIQCYQEIKINLNLLRA